MEIKERIKKIVMTLLNNIHERRKLILALSCVVVFITTYVLILPAFTLDKDKATEQGGIDVPGIEQTQNHNESKSPSDKTGVESLKYEGEGFSVEVTDVKGKHSVNEIDVREIDKSTEDLKAEYETYYAKALDAIAEDDDPSEETTVSFAKFYDISFNSDGAGVSESNPASVIVSYDKDGQKQLPVDDKDNVRIVRLTTDEKTEEIVSKVIDNKSVEISVDKGNLADAEFEATESAVYAVLCIDSDKQESETTDSDTTNNDSEEKGSSVKKAVISAGDDNYEITVSYGEDAMIPDDAELVVHEISSDDSKYSDLCNNAIEELNKTGDVLAEPLAVSISIKSNGKEIEPAEGSKVDVDIKLVKSALNGEFTNEDSSILVNDEPLTEANADIQQEFQVVHEMSNGDIEVVDNDNNITDEEIQSSFTTDSFSDWLLFLDETVENITIGIGDTLTLRPYSKWVWKKDAEEEQYQNYQWKVPTSNVITFTQASKHDSELNEDYVYYHGQANGTGTFDLQLTDNGTVVHTIHVTVVNDVQDTPPTVQGTDEIAVNLFDYDINPSDPTKSGSLDQEANVASSGTYRNTSINRYSDLKFLGYGGSNTNSEWFSINNYTRDVPSQGILNPRLVDGYPQLGLSTNGNTRSHPGLKYLFDTSTEDTQPNDMIAYPNVTGLFQKDNGYYYYNSNSNYAYYDPANGNKQITLYSHTYSQWTSGSAGPNAKPIGFFPFHKYDSYLKEGNTGMNFNTYLNHHFGMSMTVDFEIPSDGLDDYGNPITFEFSGDDDMWVFIDDNLVLDVGGIHQPVTGSINFSSDKVSVYGENDTTITQRFIDAGSPTDWEIGDGKPHTMKVFYLERGGCDSNLSLKFNTPRRLGKSKLSLVKREEGKTTPLQGAEFRIWENAKCEGDPIGEYVTDENGAISLGEFVLNSKTDTYYLKETSSPNGYIRDTNVYQIIPRLDAQGEFVKDSTGDYVIMDVYGPDGSILTKLDNYSVVFPNSKINKIDIPVEKTWLGDPTDNAKITLKIKRYKLIDKTKGFMIIKELSGEPDDYAFDADYKITYPDGHEETISYSTFTDGIYSPENPAPGNYVIEEIVKSDAPDGYTMTHTSHSVEVVLEEDAAAQANFKTTFERDKGELYIKANLIFQNGGSSSDIDYSKVRYAVLDSTGKKVTSITHEQAINGTPLSLPTGTYTVKSVSIPKTPANYERTEQYVTSSGMSAEGTILNNITVAANQRTEVDFNTTYRKQNSAQNCNWIIMDQYGNQQYKSGSVNYPAGTILKMSFEVPQNQVWGGNNNFDVSYGGQSLTGYISQTQNNYEYSVEFTVSDNKTLTFRINGQGNTGYKRVDITGPEFDVVGHVNSLNSSALFANLTKSAKMLADSANTLALSADNNVTHPEAPAGKKYIKDNEWSETVILNSANSWKDTDTLKNLPACDDEGNKYYYYVASVDEEGIDDNTICSINLDGSNQLLIGEDMNAGQSLGVTNTVTKSISVSKVWADGSPEDHPSSVQFRIYQECYYLEGDEPKLYSEDWYSDEVYTITGSETTTVSGLPTQGRAVVGGETKTLYYDYRVVEMPVEGYHADYSTDGTTVTITNTPIEESEHNTELEVAKSWLDINGDDASGIHENDKIGFKLTRRQIKADDIVPVTVLYSAPEGQLIQQELYVTKGTKLRFVFNKPRTAFTHEVEMRVGNGRTQDVGGTSAGPYEYTTSEITEPTTITARLTWTGFWIFRGNDRWGDQIEEFEYSVQWTHSVVAATGKMYDGYDALLADVLENGEPEDSTEDIPYTLGKDSIEADIENVPYTVSVIDDWYAKFTDLPQMQKIGDDYYIYTYEISEFKIINDQGEIESVGNTENQDYSGETTNYYVKWVKGSDGKWTITNQEKPVHVEFIKNWLDASGQKEAWPEGLSIKVTVTGETASNSKSYVYTIDKDHSTAGSEITATSPASAPKLKVDSTNDNNYKFVLDGLDRFDSQGEEYVYTISETNHPDGYQEPHYILASGEDAGEGRTSTDNGGTIENAITTYVLPHTGGIGTTIFYIMGSILAIGCAVVLISRRRLRKN